jgi:flagellar motility protein MotE (MotC chaperone)
MKEGRKTIWVRLAVALFLSVLLVSTASAQKTKRKKVAPPSPPPPTVTAKELKELNDAARESRENLITASNTYRESLERLLALQKQDEKRASELVEKRKELLDLGIIARKDVTEGEQLLADAKAKSAETEKQLVSVDHLVAEVNAAEELAKLPPEPQGTFRSTGMLVRFVGLSRWNLSDFGKVDAFFRLKFSKPIPVSAFGQTETHNRLGFNHSSAMDVALHPDSAEGQALIEFLQNQGISFIAIRGAIPGSATGAHIHIGPESRRISIKP